MQVLETRCDWVVTGSGGKRGQRSERASGSAVNAWGGAGNATALPALVNGGGCLHALLFKRL